MLRRASKKVASRLAVILPSVACDSHLRRFPTENRRFDFQMRSAVSCCRARRLITRGRLVSPSEDSPRPVFVTRKQYHVEHAACLLPFPVRSPNPRPTPRGRAAGFLIVELPAAIETHHFIRMVASLSAASRVCVSFRLVSSRNFLHIANLTASDTHFLSIPLTSPGGYSFLFTVAALEAHSQRVSHLGRALHSAVAFTFLDWDST